MVIEIWAGKGKRSKFHKFIYNTSFKEVYSEYSCCGKRFNGTIYSTKKDEVPEEDRLCEKCFVYSYKEG